MKIIQKTLATLCFVSVAFCSTAYSADKVTLRFAHPMTKVSSVAKGYIKFKHLVEAASGGDIEVQFYENQSFFGDARMNVGFMLDGTLDMTALSSSNLSYFVPELMAFSVPYIVQPKNQDKLYAAIDNGALGTTLDDAIEKVGAIPLMYSEYGYRNFASVDTPLKSLNDLKGLKLRICDSQAEKSLDEALMMKPKYYAWGAVPMLLRLGFIEGESNKFAAMYQADHADRLGHVMVSEHDYSMHILLINKQKWQTLSVDQQKLIRTAASQALNWQRKDAQNQEMIAKKAFRDKGITLTTLDAEGRKKLQTATTKVTDKIRKDLPEGLLQLIEDTQK